MRRQRPIRPGTGIAVRQTILWTGVLAVAPLLLYPKTFGIGHFGFHPAIVLVEWCLYFAALLFVAPMLQASQRVIAAGMTVVYRLACACLFAGLAAFNNDFGFTDTVAVAMWSYPFTVLLHIGAAPFVLAPVWRLAFAPPAPKARFAMSPATAAKPRPSVAAAFSSSRAAVTHVRPSALRPQSHPNVPQPEQIPDYDAAVAYVGEYSGIRMCWLVDHEGLPLAFWQRQDYTGAVDYWAPISMEIIGFDRNCLSVGGEVEPQRVEIRTRAGRVILEAVDEFWLGVLTDHEVDDLVGVRLSQARDMISKFVQRRRENYAVLQEV